MHITVAKCFICFTHIIPFRAAHLPRTMETRRDAASPCAAGPLTTSSTRHILPDSETPNSESNRRAVVEKREAQGEVVTKPLCKPSELKEQRGQSPIFSFLFRRGATKPPMGSGAAPVYFAGTSWKPAMDAAPLPSRWIALTANSRSVRPRKTTMQSALSESVPFSRVAST